MTLEVPPLRERPDDIPALVEATLQHFCIQWNLPQKRVSPAFLTRLVAHSWPGNVRELQHAIGQTILLEDERTLSGHNFQPSTTHRMPLSASAATSPQRSLHERATTTLAELQGNKSAAAKALGVTRKTLYRWLVTTSAR